MPPPAEAGDIYALKALARGQADSDQQIRALDWIVVQASRFYEMSHRSGPGDTSFEEGRRYVGWSIVNFTRMRMTRREEEPDEQG